MKILFIQSIFVLESHSRWGEGTLQNVFEINKNIGQGVEKSRVLAVHVYEYQDSPVYPIRATLQAILA